MALVAPAAQGLIDRPSLARLRKVTASLPAYVAEFLGFERRIGGSQTGTDFAISLSAPGFNWVIESRRWPRLSKLLQLWQARRPHDAITVWLEFDASERASRGRPPNAFIAIDRLGGEPFAPPSEIAPPVLQRCIDACPPSVARLQLGFMFSRTTAALRLCILPMTFREAVDFLHRVAWPGSLEDVGRVLASYESLCDGFGIHLDVADSPAASLGVELLYAGRAQDRQPDAEPRWNRLFARLIDDGLCTAPERDALFAWVSQRVFEASPPARLLAAIFHPDQMVLHGTLHTGLQHVKLYFGPKAAIHAKAYFGAVLEARE